MSSVKTADFASFFMLAVLLVVIMKSLSFIFIPLSIALLLSYALGAPLDFLKKYNIPSFLRIIIVTGTLILACYLFGNLVQSNILEFKSQLPELENKFWAYMEHLLGYLDMNTEQAVEIYNSFLSNIQAANLKPIGMMLRSISVSFFAFLGNLFWVVLFFIFLLAEKESFTRRVTAAFGRKNSDSFMLTIDRVNTAIQNYLGLKTLISILTGLLIYIALLLFSVPFALLWGLLAFVFNFIPNIGSLVAAVPPVAVSLFYSGSLLKALLVTAVFTAIQIMVGNFIEPRVMGKGLNLSPLTVLISLLFWGWLWGITGMLVSIPLTAAIKIGLEQIETTRPLAVMMSGSVSPATKS